LGKVFASKCPSSGTVSAKAVMAEPQQFESGTSNIGRCTTMARATNQAAQRRIIVEVATAAPVASQISACLASVLPSHVVRLASAFAAAKSDFARAQGPEVTIT
jgi:hypothetical protein